MFCRFLFTVFVDGVYTISFLLCYGSKPNCSVIGPNEKHWPFNYSNGEITTYVFTSESMSSSAQIAVFD